MNITVTEEEAQVTATYMDALQLSNRTLAKALEEVEAKARIMVNGLPHSRDRDLHVRQAEVIAETCKAALKERMSHDT